MVAKHHVAATSTQTTNPSAKARAPGASHALPRWRAQQVKFVIHCQPGDGATKGEER